MCPICSKWSCYARRGHGQGVRQAFRAVAVWVIAILIICCCVSPAAAADPSLSGFLTVSFAFHPDDADVAGDQSFWSFSGHSQSLVLTLPSVLEISAIPGAGTLSWSNSANWSTFPLDTSGFSINTSGSGSYAATVNNGQGNLNVLNGSGPTESSTITNVGVTNINSPGYGPSNQRANS